MRNKGRLVLETTEWTVNGRKTMKVTLDMDKSKKLEIDAFAEAVSEFIEHVRKVCNCPSYKEEIWERREDGRLHLKRDPMQNPDKKISDDMVDRPKHYASIDGHIQAIDIIEQYALNFSLGNAVKYILRAQKKDDYYKDLQKAIWYLQRELDTRSNLQ